MNAPECDLADAEVYLRQALEAMRNLLTIANMRIRVLEDQLKVEASPLTKILSKLDKEN